MTTSSLTIYLTSRKYVEFTTSQLDFTTRIQNVSFNKLRTLYFSPNIHTCIYNIKQKSTHQLKLPKTETLKSAKV